MADPIMDLFEDTPLFDLDALPDDSFSQGSSDPVEEALKLALGQAVPTGEPESTPDLAVSSSLGVPVAAPVISDPAPVHVPTQQPVAVAPVQTVSVAPAIEAGAATFMTSAPVPVETVPQMQAQPTIPVASNTSGVSSTTVLLSSPLTVSSPPATTTTATTQQLTQITHQLTPQQLAAITQQAGGKIVILKGPQGQAQVLQTVSGTTGQTGGKVIRLLSGTTLKPAGIGNWRHWQPSGVADIPGPRRTEGGCTSQNASPAAATSSGGTVSVVKVINPSTAAPSATTTSPSQAIRITKAPGEPAAVRRVEILCKQEKANRIVAEAIARAKARGEKNLPRVLNQDELPTTQTSPEMGGVLTVVSAAKKKSSCGGSKKKSPVSGGPIPKIIVGTDKKGKVMKISGGTIAVSGGPVIPGAGNKSKSKAKAKRSNRVVKRKKYTEDLDIKITDDEDEQEDVDVTTTAAAVASISGGAAAQLKQEVELDGDGLPSMQFFVDEEPFNPDYVEVDRILDVSHSVDKDNGEPVIYYLVKWCSLPYEDATWELKEDVDEGKVEEFGKIQNRQPRLKRTARPAASAWKKLEETREYKNGNTLREYQLEGVNWLLFNWYNRQNCILADEMGLGKTIQSITLLSEVYATGIQGPFLVIAPLSTITNWEREFSTWTHMNAIVYHGSLASRQMIQQYEMYCKDDKGHLIPGAYKFDALITTFEMVLSDCPELREIAWRCVIIDEAHRLKNRNCKLLDSLKMLDLKLQSILKPMMLRRLKEDVEKNLAPKQETIIEVELTDIQKKYYRAILERNFSFLSLGANSNSNVPNLLNTMMELRKCCNHPYLINGAEEKIVAELREKYDPLAPDFHLQALIRSAGKLVLLDKLLPRLKAGGHKVLIFSQMVRCLDILEDYLINKRYRRIDGRVRGNLRQAAIDRFSKPDSDRFVFLLCTRAGGLGINLTAADTCVIFDSDWNPQNDLQVYRLITRNSYEREMLDKASLKLGLDRAVLQSMSGNKDSNVNGQFSKKEIEDLLRKGAYAAIMDENDEGSRFCEEDIDQILQRRATTITIESEGKGSTFSKASFVASENRTDIALDDPEFWQKWAKKADIDMDSFNQKYSSLRGEGGDLSDLDSDDEYPPANSRHSRSSRRSDRHSGGGYGRTDCFRVEKHLLVYGWGRWRDILAHARCKRRLSERDVETICRVILVFCLMHYRGDENIKSFIWELITPPENGREPQTLLNHSGYEMYTTMRADPCLCFVERVGRPDDKAIDAEQHTGDAELGDDADFDKFSEDPEFKPASRLSKDLFDEVLVTAPDSMNVDDEISVEDKTIPVVTESATSQSGVCEWPSSSSLTARLRRLITAYQRSYRQEQLKIEAEAKGDRKRRRWTRREESDFYRVVSTFGVEKIKKEPGVSEDREAEFDWTRFRTFARLDKKTDESLSRYFRSFVVMCRRVCHLRPDPSELTQTVAPITEERASRTLYRISLLRRLRERVLPHPSLEEHLLLAPRSSELPAWWTMPDHDRQLMLGAALHGVSRTELSIFSDPQFTFSSARDEFIQNQQALPPPPPPPPIMTFSQPKSEMELPGVKGEGTDESPQLFGGGISTALHSTPLSHLGGKLQGAMKVGNVDEENSLLSMTPSQDSILPPEPIRLDWPKDRVLINRLDNLCNLVLTGQWPSGRRYIPEAQLHQSSELVGEEMAYTRVIRKPSSTPGGIGAEGEDGEFTVKLLKEEGLKLTFSKQALMPNGSGGEGSGRKKRKDQEVHLSRFLSF
ncbi:hypothetical protein GOODEAATRI_000349 [Goodea atripinnis]|uniref:DNA helicase n=1 Tax=Goodea atripinnis TaxID=208336 RepID=A0ABV0MYC1_9TELE